MPNPPASRAAWAIWAGVLPAPVDLLVDAEHQQVVAAHGGHLVTGQQERAPVPALLAIAGRGQRVVVGEQHHVHARALARARDLGHRPGAIRMRGMQVDDAGDVVEIGHGSRLVALTA